MASDKDTNSQLLLPVLLISFVVAGFLSFQSYLLVTDHAALSAAYEEQTKTLEQVEKVRTQVSALVKGTMELAKKGNKDAQVIIDDLKKAGVNFEDQPQKPEAGAPPAAAPEIQKR